MEDIIYNGALFNSILHVIFLYHLEGDIHINKQTVALQNIDLIF